jgi:Flp pilus assembly protein TadD
VKGLLVIAVLLVSPSIVPAVQVSNVHAPRQGHTLYGDLRVEAKGAAKDTPMSFLVTLSTASGNVYARNNVPGGGRYHFLDVPNGEYDIIIERDNLEVGRVRILIQEMRFTDIRKDITLELREDAPAGNLAKTSTLSSAEAYARGPENSALFEKALKAGSNKDYGGAVSLLRQMVAADPKDFEAWAELGTMQFMKGDQGEAEKSYGHALEARPSYFVALLNLGKLQIARKDLDGAIVSLSKAVESQPRSPEANYFLGEAYLQNRKGSKAVGYLNEALRLDPAGMADAHLRLAALYNGANMKDRAAAEYEQFLAKKPDYPEKKKLEQYIRDNKKP